MLLERIETGKHIFCGSAALFVENEQNPNQERKTNVNALIAKSTEWIAHNDDMDQRVQALMGLGFRSFDAYHVASAEAGKCDRLLTCDDRLLNTARRNAAKLTVKVTDLLSFNSEPAF